MDLSYAFSVIIRLFFWHFWLESLWLNPILVIVMQQHHAMSPVIIGLPEHVTLFMEDIEVTPTTCTNSWSNSFRTASKCSLWLPIKKHKSRFLFILKVIIQGSYFSTDVVNRMGMHKMLTKHSNEMWKNGKDIMKYILERGGKMGTHFKASNVQIDSVKGEVESMATALDVLKKQAENAINAHKHSMGKKSHLDDTENDSYDPAVIKDVFY
jgi:hypothetical protein